VAAGRRAVVLARASQARDAELIALLCLADPPRGPSQVAASIASTTIADRLDPW
jgi:hypothetical protein